MRIVRSERQVAKKAQRLTLKWYKPLINTYEVVCIFFHSERHQFKQRGDSGPEYDKAAGIIASLYPRERHQKGKAIMVKVNCNDERILAEMFSIFCYPTYHVIKNGERMITKYPRTQTAESFLQLIEEFIAEKVERQPEPDTSRFMGFAIYTDKITLESYRSFVKENDFVFIFFYATWYQSCKDALAEFEKAYIEISNVYQTKYRLYTKSKPVELVFARMEAGINSNVIKKFSIRKYPTFKLVVNGHVKADYNSQFTVEGFVNFIKGHLERHRKEKCKMLM